jgi:hypothetical protein
MNPLLGIDSLMDSTLRDGTDESISQRTSQRVSLYVLCENVFSNTPFVVIANSLDENTLLHLVSDASPNVRGVLTSSSFSSLSFVTPTSFHLLSSSRFLRSNNTT